MTTMFLLAVAALWFALIVWADKLYREREEIRDADGSLYMIRYFLYRPNNPKRGRVYLHHVIRSDHDRALHDHPWGFISLILWGGYLEVADMNQELPGKGWKAHSVAADDGGLKSIDARKWFRPGSLLFRPASWRHRLVIPEGHDAWTLVKTTPKQRDWGFWPGGRFCHWRKYDTALGICNEDNNGMLKMIQRNGATGYEWNNIRQSMSVRRWILFNDFMHGQTVLPFMEEHSTPTGTEYLRRTLVYDTDYNRFAAQFPE